ncbi:integrase catalytic domain-containing protein [Trichonephila clavipes]|nr:integrase catalytic domain-containing protein [Trichonephila clavipes]
MFDCSKPDDDVVNFVSKLKSHMQSLHPKPPKHHSKRPVFIHPGLLEATHVFLRRDMLRRPLQQPYDGPFKVLQRKDKVFFLDINGKRVSVSIDRCKPAFFLNTEDFQLPQTKNETPATVEPNASASTPATVESDPTASTPTQPSTRSGRKVHLPTRTIDDIPATVSKSLEALDNVIEEIEQEANAPRRSRVVLRRTTTRRNRKHMSAADIHHQITEVYGTEAMSDSKVRKWLSSFKMGERTSMTKNAQAGPL